MDLLTIGICVIAVLAFGAYVAYLVVPPVVAGVVPAVVDAVIKAFES